MFVTGPKVVKAVTNETVDFETLGGAEINSTRSGNAHFAVESEHEALKTIKKLIEYLPPNCKYGQVVSSCTDPKFREEESLNKVIPENSNYPYDMKQIIAAVVDDGKFLEIHKNYAMNIIVAFSKLNGRTVGIVANQPNYLAGVLDSNASRKAARFVRFCDSFNIPILTFIDVPGFLPGTDQEYGGIITHGAKLLFAYSEATVPKVSVITRKAYGGAYDVMSSKHIGGDMNYAWPTAEIAVMGAEGAAEIIFKKDIKNADNPEKVLEEKITYYKKEFANPYQAAKRGYIDDIIIPSKTRSKIIRAFEILSNKKESQPDRKHSNIPL